MKMPTTSPFKMSLVLISHALINIVQRTFQKNSLANAYIVNLSSCKQNDTVFSFKINSLTGDLTSGLGRTLEVGCFYTLGVLQKS